MRELSPVPSLLAGLAALALGACTIEVSRPYPPADPYATRLAAPARLVAIGDLHGDLDATRAALRLAGAIDTLDRWIGRDLVVVQTGDILDRGDEERAVFGLLAALG